MAGARILRRAQLLLLALLILLAAGGCTGGARPADAITIAYTGDFFGFQRPCG